LAIATGTTHWINPADQAYENGILVLDGHGTAGGYTLDTGDIVTAYWKTGLETACMYPVSALKGIVAASDTSTVLHFASILGDATDDTITFTHASLGFEHICKEINDACNAYPKDGRIIKVDPPRRQPVFDYPIVEIDSSTGAGADIEMTLEALPPTSDELTPDDILPANIVEVIDCVGKNIFIKES